MLTARRNLVSSPHSNVFSLSFSANRLDQGTPAALSAHSSPVGRASILSEFSRSASKHEVFSYRRILDGMFASCQFMKMAVNRSINFTKASANISLQASLETFEIASCISHSIDIIRMLNNDIDITFAPLPVAMCPFVISDQHWLGENILCLLSNAIKYSDGGPIHVAVSLHSAVDTAMGASSVRATVIDSGIGVPPESRGRLFQPFSQMQRMAGGTGLGLYSLRKRMEALGGSCGLDSRADGLRGSEFWFEFPYRPDPSAAPESGCSPTSASALQSVGAGAALTGSAAAAAAAAAAANGSGSGDGGTSSGSTALSVGDSSSSSPAKRAWAVRRSSNADIGEPISVDSAPPAPAPLRILLVEDSAFILKMATQMLVKMGHKVETAANGSIGLDRLSKVHDTSDDFDLVLCDFQMPVRLSSCTFMREANMAFHSTFCFRPCTQLWFDSLQPGDGRFRDGAALPLVRGAEASRFVDARCAQCAFFTRIAGGARPDGDRGHVGQLGSRVAVAGHGRWHEFLHVQAVFRGGHARHHLAV